MLLRRVLLTASLAGALALPTMVLSASAAPPGPVKGKAVGLDQRVSAGGLDVATVASPSPVTTTSPDTVQAAGADAATTQQGANGSSPNPYAPAGVGSPTHQGGGNAPENGTVGAADDKYPPGQSPNGRVDANSGYECDANSGVGNNGGNPAHSGCLSPSPAKTTPPPTTPPPVCTQSCETTSPSPTPPTEPPTQKPTCIGDICGPHTTTPQPVCQTEPCEPPIDCTTLGPGIDRDDCETPVVCVGTDATGKNHCLPFTGMNADDLAYGGGFALTLGVLFMLLANMQRQLSRYIRQY